MRSDLGEPDATLLLLKPHIIDVFGFDRLQLARHGFRMTAALSLRRTTVVVVLLASTCGCQDGPLYRLKYANPYFTMREWKQDRELGVTDHERREELQSLANQIGGMPQQEQVFWGTHLERIMNNDPSPEMRRLAVLAAGRAKAPNALQLIEQGLDDESIKVQMEACRALGRRGEPEAARLLASTVGTTTELDVKHSAISALGKHKGEVPIDSLRIALSDQNPATIDVAIKSLRDVTGKNFGRDPKQWIAALDHSNSSSAPGTPPLPAPTKGSSNPIRYAQGENGFLR